MGPRSRIKRDSILPLRRPRLASLEMYQCLPISGPGWGTRAYIRLAACTPPLAAGRSPQIVSPQARDTKDPGTNRACRGRVGEEASFHSQRIGAARSVPSGNTTPRPGGPTAWEGPRQPQRYSRLRPRQTHEQVMRERRPAQEGGGYALREPSRRRRTLEQYESAVSTMKRARCTPERQQVY